MLFLCLFGLFNHRFVKIIFDDDKVQKVVSTVGEVAKSRKQQLAPNNSDEFGMLNSFPFEVNVNGATIFVLEVAEHYKL